MYYPLIQPTYINVLDALEELGTCVPWAEYPTLTEDDALKALYKSRLVDVLGRPPDQYSIWRPLYPYRQGDQIVPTTLNGHYYTHISVDESSSGTEPVWNTEPGSITTEGSVQWQESGQALWYGRFDINYAAALLWVQKAGKVAHMTQQSVDGQSFNPQQMSEQFLAMAKYYKRMRGIRSVPYRSAIGRLPSPYRSADWIVQ